jgi:hypothetical protein
LKVRPAQYPNQQQQQHQKSGGGGPHRNHYGNPRKAPYDTQHRTLRNMHCNNCNGYGHGFKVCKKPCTACGQYGHSAHMCAKGRTDNRQRSANASAGYHASTSFPPGFQPTGHAFPASGTYPPPPPAGGHAGYLRNGKWDWIVDDGATNHMTYRKDLLHNYVHDPAGQVSGLTPAAVQREGYGTLRFMTTIDGRKHYREVHNVWYIPGISINLLSAQELKRHGAYRLGKSGSMDEWWFDRDNQVFLYSQHVNGTRDLTPCCSLLLTVRPDVC